MKVSEITPERPSLLTPLVNRHIRSGPTGWEVDDEQITAILDINDAFWVRRYPDQDLDGYPHQQGRLCVIDQGRMLCAAQWRRSHSCHPALSPDHRNALGMDWIVATPDHPAG